MNIVDPILFNAKINPEAIAICTPGTAVEFVTYGQLARMINNVGRMAQSAGLARGNIVAILVEDKIFHCALILGLASVGIATVSARTTTLPRELGVTAVITDRQATFINCGRTVVANPFIWSTAGDGKPLADGPAFAAADDGLCRIVLTSGTTGEPKGIAYTHRTLQLRLARYAYALGPQFARVQRLYSDLGIATATGFRCLVYLLSRGGTIFFYGADAESAVQAFGLYQVEGMVASPHGLSEYVRFYEAASHFQCPFEFIVSLGSALPRSLSRRVCVRMTPNLYSVYGSTEVSTVAIAPASAVADIPGAVGYVAPEVEVEIADASGQPLPPGREGSVRIRSKHNVDGYFGDAVESARAFRNGWFYPGDVGRLTGDRMLVILGRDNTVLNIGGDKIRPELVEEALTSYPGIEQAGVFTRPGPTGISELWAAVVSNLPPDEPAIREYCRHRLGEAFTPAGFVRVKALPRNDLGKIDRARLATTAS